MNLFPNQQPVKNLPNTMSTRKRYLWLQSLQRQLDQAVAAEKKKARIHIIIVHANKWWCVYVNISTETPRDGVLTTLKIVRRNLKILWPKRFCVPREKNGRDKTSVGPLDYGMEYNFEFWLPGKQRTSKDFKIYSHPAQKGKTVRKS